MLAIVVSFTDEVILTSVSAKFRFFEPSSIAFMVFVAIGAQEPFSINAT